MIKMWSKELEMSTVLHTRSCRSRTWQYFN